MTSTAISAQGSTLGAATTTAPSPVNLSSITVSASATATTTLFTTAAAHGLVSGALVTPTGVTGADAALLNGLSFPVTVVSPTTFTIQLNTFGKTLTATSATITGTNYVYVGNMRTFNGLDGQASEIDVTNLASKAKEIRLGLVDYGQIQIEIDLDLADAGQQRALALYQSGGQSNWVLTLPNGNVASFQAFARRFSVQGGVDQVVRRTLELRISGPVTWC